MVELLHDTLAGGVAACFKYKTRSKKSSEPAWMTDWLRDLIEDRRIVFHTDGGRSERWLGLKKRTSRIVKDRRGRFDAHVVAKMESDPNPGNFFKHIDGLLGANSKPRWSPHDLFPKTEPELIAEELAAFFNSISNEYHPLNVNNLPICHQRSLPIISEADVIERLKKAKKPNSTVPGDIPPVLYNHFATELARPITLVFNKITESLDWPVEERVRDGHSKGTQSG